jgi:hypothetical protein
MFYKDLIQNIVYYLYINTGPKCICVTKLVSNTEAIPVHIYLLQLYI